jgi:hypothetical protein
MAQKKKKPPKKQGKRRKKKTPRECLTCFRIFYSVIEPAYNRICPKCTKANSNKDDYGPPDPVPQGELYIRRNPKND